MNLFFSGHSLTEAPLGEYTAAVAASLGKQTLWNQQIALGSPIRFRTRGFSDTDPSWAGYSQGINRDGASMNFLAELRNPQTLNGQRYDALIVTERHDLPLEWEGGVKYARHMHERLIEGNPQATSYIYHAWQGIRDKSNPAPWIAHERAAATVWQCMASRINTSLAHEGRSDRVHYMPAGLALAYLVERATQGYVDGITAGSPAETLNRLFRDDVHLNTGLGVYYMSLVTYASVYRNAPSGAWAPAGVSATQARSLQEVAWAAVSSYYNNPVQPDLNTCQAIMRNDFCARIAYYTNNAQNINYCVSTFGKASNENPFYFSPAVDNSYWAPAP